MAIGMNDLKTGLTIEYSNSIWRVLDFQHVKPGKGGAFVRSKLKNLRTGAVNEVTFRPGDKFEQADITTRPMSYLYAENDGRDGHAEQPAHRTQPEKELLQLLTGSVCAGDDDGLEYEPWQQVALKPAVFTDHA